LQLNWLLQNNLDAIFPGMNAPRALIFRPSAVLEAAGEDTFSFLQGQLSNDLKPRGPGKVTYGLWLSAKGKVDGDSFLIERADGSFLIVSPDCPADALRTRLEAFIIADDVVLTDVTQRWSGIAVWGERAAESAAILGVPVPEGREATIGNGVVGIASHRWGHGTIEWLFETGGDAAAEASNKLAGAGFALLTDSTAGQDRILGGGVAVPAELGPGDLPQEAGVEEIAVSFTKGCYIGQEVMARLKSMGRVRRGLIRVRGDGPPAAVPADLFANGRKVGELRSAAPLDTGGFVGRAMVTLTDLPGEFSIGSADPTARRVKRDGP
jgi:tRNA-modifying protein YgfZ